MTREWVSCVLIAAMFSSLAACSVYNTSLVGRKGSSQSSDDAGELPDAADGLDSAVEPVDASRIPTKSRDAAVSGKPPAAPDEARPGTASTPNDGCEEREIAGHVYYFCSQPTAWPQALAHCRNAYDANLARIADGTQARLLAENVERDTWIGHHVLRDSLWVWSDNSVPFWNGGPDGKALFGRMSTWASGEPKVGNGCGVLRSSAELASGQCTDEKPFVCERSPDACPDDPAKADPGQCGCGMADTDADKDGFASCNDACDDDQTKPVPEVCGCDSDKDADGDGAADCNDGCPDDPKKTAAGACGCGTSDNDADGDGVADCRDECRQDARKQAPGVCGCGTADTDTDRDGTPDCKDGCPRDATTTNNCFPFSPANIDPKQLDFGSAPSSRLNCGTTTIDTSSSPARIDNWCGTAPKPIVRKLNNGPEIVVIPLRGLSIDSNNGLRLVGSRPIAFAIRGDVTIAGVIDASASGATPGPGGNWSCGSSQGGAGQSQNNATGGGGGGFSTNGGAGGDDTRNAAPGVAGASRGNSNLVPLIGGCGGGAAGGCNNPPGAGGGAVQISASGKLVVTGSIRANGGQGGDHCGNNTAGAGGGSGGAILLESAGTMNMGMLVANGGNGGGGDHGREGEGSTANNATGRSGVTGLLGGSGGGGGGYGRVVVR